MATRWGICSVGLISSDFCTALRSLPASEHEIVAAGARSKEKAEEFAQKFNISKAYGSYEEVARDPNVEIGYVGVIHPHHYRVCCTLLEHGKHVLCEKPLTLTLHETKDLVARARAKGLFFMEGLWTRFFPAAKRVREELANGSLGNVNFLRASFCVPIAHVPRVADKALGGGGLVDLGVYPMLWANMVFREKPEQIVAVGHLTDTGVDKNGTIVLKYKSGSTAVLMWSIDTQPGHNNVTIYGSKGNLHVVESLQCPTVLLLPSGERKEFPLPSCDKHFTFENSIGFTYQAQAVRECLLKGEKECPVVPHQDSVDIAEITTEALKQLGVQY